MQSIPFGAGVPGQGLERCERTPNQRGHHIAPASETGPLRTSYCFAT